MKTKPIPAIVMLVAGLVVCIAGMAGHMETGRFVKMLLVVLIVFYIIGGIVKLLIDKNFKDMEEETTDGEETPAEAAAPKGGDTRIRARHPPPGAA